MKPDDFEQRLQRQPLRQIPAGWREEILAAACEAQPQPTRQASLVTRHSFWAILDARLATLLWPHPRAWAGLAAVWVLILALNVSMPGKTAVVMGKVTPPSPEVVAALKQQQRMLAELIGASQVPDVLPPRLLPSPRSEWTEMLMT